ncbi:MSHA biogenesis protein MshF [Shewanella sp. CG12_big_fil_rev_8_21_14_0_65_47_15]|uniref:MSHA biogenesis protein MshF n=1 Tax=Shewanella sp. CG12_big_fil_rev_8_21_14_0_65_47_15 TaxID=1975537 RepID=UPI000CC1C67A|nr:MSHA biogenesis protein MshF [Shewanella sp. CG12_big_fil_rev_8_21_14_0_65_47_15]PIW59984.1 MAG: MSHA biogenesis protein MshF [Shewanella sp. CG12_big_fil_rev_8_21_14_0_65_47_15]
MQSQQKAEGDLLRVYGRMITIILVLVMMAVIGIRYFSTMPQVAARSVELEHTRFLNVLAMVRSQWLSLGKPAQLQLDWEVFTDQSQTVGQSVVKMSALGWPQPKQLDHLGCQELWLQLMGSELQEDTLVGEFLSKDTSCRYRSQNGDSIGYQLNSGRVIFLTQK